VDGGEFYFTLSAPLFQILMAFASLLIWTFQHLLEMRVDLLPIFTFQLLKVHLMSICPHFHFHRQHRESRNIFYHNFLTPLSSLDQTIISQL